MSAREKALEIINKALSEGRKVLVEPEAKRICELYGIKVPKFDVAKSPEEAVEIAKRVGLPVVMKIVSPDILHKSDIGGVFVGVKTEEEVLQTYNKIMENVKAHAPNARVYGILVQRMAPQGIETIIGSIRDAQFGPTVMFGLGGIFVEILKDVSLRVAPITLDDAYEMIREIKGFKILEGYRGYYKADIDSLAEMIVRVSKMVTELEPIEQLDLNPVFVYKEGEGSLVIDARMILKP